MLKNLAILEVEVNGRKYQMILSPDSPLGEVFDALTSMRSFVITKINDAAKDFNEVNDGLHEQS